MFDYQRWSAWLEGEALKLESQAFLVRFNRADDTPKPGASLGASSDNVVGSFAIWNTGEADYDITNGRGEAVAHKWGMLLSDRTFIEAFEEFANLLSKLQ